MPQYLIHKTTFLFAFFLIAFPLLGAPAYEDYQHLYNHDVILKATEIVKQSRLPEKNEGGFLIPPPGINPVNTFVGVAEGLRPLVKYEDPQDLYIPELGVLASVCFEKMTTHLTDTEQKYEIGLFRQENSKYIANKKTSYLWFVVFMDRLAMLLTKPEDRKGIHNSNNFYELTCMFMFKTEIGCFFHHHETYMGYVNSNFFTKATSLLATLPAIAKRHFPILMPYPYALDSYAIVCNLPTPQGGAWLEGIPVDLEWADGEYYSPAKFKAHDDAHLLRFLEGLCSISAMLLETHGKSATRALLPTNGAVVTLLAKRKIIALAAIELAKRFVKAQGRANPWDTFFPMLFLHESLFPIKGAVDLIDEVQDLSELETQYSVTLENERLIKELYPAVPEFKSALLFEDKVKAIVKATQENYPLFRAKFRSFILGNYPDIMNDIKGLYSLENLGVNTDRVFFYFPLIFGSVFFRSKQENEITDFQVDPNDFKFMNFSEPTKNTMRVFQKYWLFSSLLNYDQGTVSMYSMHITTKSPDFQPPIPAS